MKFRLWFAVLVLLALALAQDDVLGLGGIYPCEGGSGDGADTGAVTLSGTGQSTG